MHQVIKKLFKSWLMLGLVLTTISGHTIAADPKDLLSPNEAFRISADGTLPDKIRVKWAIADGYYLYTSKIRFSTDSDNITLTAANFPPAEEIEDEFFGRIDVFRGETIIDIPVVKDDKTPEIITLNARSQGCADIGVCFPPQTQTVLVALNKQVDRPAPISADKIAPVVASGTGAEDTDNTDDGSIDPLAALQDLDDDLGFGNEEDEILPPEKAYQLSYSFTDQNVLKLDWKIAEGTYLYNDKISFKLEGDEGIKIGEYKLPKPKTKENGVRPDGTIGDIKIYKTSLNVDVPLLITSTTGGLTNLTVSYQGCAERGICYPPVKTVIPVNFPAQGAGSVSVGNLQETQQATKAQQSETTDNQPVNSGSEEDKIANLIRESSTLAMIGVFFLIGLGLAFTPCVFPMIPILSGIISGQENITTRKATYLSVIYVLAMAVTYTAAGVLAAMSGENLQILLQIPWVIALFSAIFVALAFSMFGFYELQLPSSLQSKLTEISNKQSGGNTIGVAIMGLLSALIVGPCVAPPLAGALLYISQTNDPVIGGLALFAMSMGMGVPLILIGASAGKLLPRAGGWMDTVKAVFGVSMLGLAIWFLERILPDTIILLLWSMLFIGSSIYMGALQQLPIEASGWQKLWKGLGVVILIYGALMLVGVAAGSKDVRQPLKGLSFGSAGTGHATEVRHFKRLTTMSELDAELAAAKQSGRPVVLDFYADWCVYCKTLEKEIFPHPNSQQALGNAVLLQADVTDAGSAEAKAIMKRFGVIAPPVIVFWDTQGNELKSHKIVGDVSLEDFVAKTNAALNN